MVRMPERRVASTIGPGRFGHPEGSALRASSQLSQFWMPAEWETHEACWLAWPSAEDLWSDDLTGAQESFAGLCRAIAFAPSGTGSEALRILVPDARRERDARRALGDVAARYFRIPFGDIWLRDIAPLFVKNAAGELLAASFRFNGWGGKYVLPHDDRVALRVAEAAGCPTELFDWVLEGGAVEVDGEGTCLTTRQCLPNPNRNPELDPAALERRLAEALGTRTVLWLDRGLLNDHTDGHVDTIARFVAPGVVVCMEPRDSDDPNRDVLRAIAGDLERFQDAAGRRLEVRRIPSPGPVLGSSGDVLPASYVNFYIANHSVAVPTYGSPQDEAAVAAIAELFPGRRTLGIPARALLAGGGAFHCITQQQPAPSVRSSAR